MKKTILILLTTFFTVLLTFGQYDPKALTILDDMSNKFKTYTSFKAGFTFTLKVKRGDFKQVTRSQTSETCFLLGSEFIELATKLLDTVNLDNKGVRLIGFSVSNPAVETHSETSFNRQLLLPFEPY